ncbi:MAG: DUF4394 domain-containing protein [Bacteroidota bacterium]
MKKNIFNLKNAKKLLALGVFGVIISCNNLSKAQTIWLRSGNMVSSVEADDLSTITNSGNISGITFGHQLIGMDFRPTTGQLYLMSYESMSGNAQLYTLNLTDFSASMVGGVFQIATNQSNFGFDFNPTVDRIRITTREGMNYRVHPNTGVLLATDGNLSYAVGDANEMATPMIGSVAYTNSYIGSTSTTLYTYDDVLMNLNTQIPPNNGTQNTIGALSTGGIGNGELDIYYNATSNQNMAYFIQDISALDMNKLHSVNLTTGAASLLGNINIAGTAEDIAIQIDLNLPSEINGELVYALTSNSYLISFDSNMPSTVREHKSLSGLTAGQALVGLDSRPLNGVLYSLGYNTTSGETQLYTLNPMNGSLSIVGSSFILGTGLTHFSFDFNPTVDRIRVTTMQGNNLRLNPNSGALAFTDGNLTYNVVDVNAAEMSSVIAGAYTNSYIGGTATQLFGYDAMLNTLTLQNPPNNGTLNTIGSSGITINPLDPTLDMDFYFNSMSHLNSYYMNANVGTSNFDDFYTVDVATGTTNMIGKIGNGIAITDISVKIESNIPAMLTGQLIYAITSNNYLISFDSETPEIIRTHIPITGVSAGQTIAGMDVRPSNGMFYVLGYNSTTGESQLYTLNNSNGTLTSIGAIFTLGTGLGRISFDFNPSVDRIRIISSSGMNYRVHPDTGVLVATDGNLAFVAGDINESISPQVGAAAYTNSFGGTNNTKLFVFDEVLNTLALQSPPNNGVLNTIGSTGLMQSQMDLSSDMDVYYNHTNHTNTAFIVANMANFDMFYEINTSDATTNEIGMIGNGIGIIDIAVLIDSITTVSSTSSTQTITSCGSYFDMNNMELMNSGVYTYIIPNMNGYDSLITLNLTINQATMSTINVSSCESYLAADNQTYNTTGVYTATIPNSMNCDSVITINLTINEVVATTFVENNETTITALPSGMTYQWINCETNEAISSATNEILQPLSGTYAVIITNSSNCTDTSACVTVSNTADIDKLSKVRFSTYPNPTSSYLNIDFVDKSSHEIVLEDALGKIIFRLTLTEKNNVINLSELNKGIYFVKFQNQTNKIIIE